MKTKVKYEVINVNGVEITVDVSLLMKSEELFFNATDIAKQFGKKPIEWLDSKQAKEYIHIILEVENFHFEDLVITIQGGRHKGTWLSKKLALPFARWCSVRFEYELDRWIAFKIQEERSRKQKRIDSITGFKPLTDAIQTANNPPKFYHFSNECNLINRIVTGMDAKTFKQQHGVDSVRDALCARDLRRLNELQACDAALIKCGFGYDERKNLLTRLDTTSLEVF